MLSEKAVIISTYALCGFANFSSIAIQIGGIGGIAPNRRKDLARFGLRAVLGGSLAAQTGLELTEIFLVDIEIAVKIPDRSSHGNGDDSGVGQVIVVGHR